MTWRQVLAWESSALEKASFRELKKILSSTYITYYIPRPNSLEDIRFVISLPEGVKLYSNTNAREIIGAAIGRVVKTENIGTIETCMEYVDDCSNNDSGDINPKLIVEYWRSFEASGLREAVSQALSSPGKAVRWDEEDSNPPPPGTDEFLKGLGDRGWESLT